VNRVDVLIVGAGPTGLTLACELARRNVSFRIVEKSEDLFIGSRAKGLQPRTLEVFADLGVIDAVLAAGAPFPPFRLYAGDCMVWERSLEQMLNLPAAEASASVPYPRAWLIPQWRTDRILYERLRALGRNVEFATELSAIEPRDDAVIANLRHAGSEERVLSRYLVGADGGRSFVRKAARFSFEGTSDASERTLIGDVRVRGVRGPACHIFTREATQPSASLSGTCLAATTSSWWPPSPRTKSRSSRWKACARCSSVAAGAPTLRWKSYAGFRSIR
jgi:2-polyprenyl-6-methoxyphenol hydroxylase-like FAD-dependent oxidoreductase